MISTLIKPDRGRLQVCGYDLDRGTVRDVRRLIGYMPDQFGVFRGLNCVEYLQFFGRIFRLHGEELERRIRDVLSLTDLGPVQDQLTTALSTGVRQRLSLAKTLLHDPEVLVLDEPASGLDPRARIEIRSLLKELGRMGKTIIISSHILRDLEEICTDVAIIEQGRHVWSGPLKAVRAEGDARVDAIVEVPEADVERARALLERHESVTRTTAKGGGRIEAIIASGSGNDLLSALIREGIEIVSFTQEPVDLEALFLERTKGIIS
jgi:ABC-2 type transport system ATP-binding protein